MSKWLPLERLTSPLTLAAIDYWQKKRGTRQLPLLSDFNPAEIPKLLPYVIAVDVSGQPRVFTYRIIGEAQKQAGGINMTGKTVDAFGDFKAGFDEEIRTLYNEICERKELCATCGSMAWADRTYRRFENIHLPFSRNGSEVDRIILVTAYEDRLLPGTKD